MKKTMIISAMVGCGKTWLASHQEELGYSVCDIDSSTYDKTAGWEQQYVDDLVKQVQTGKYDFITVTQARAVLDELDGRGVPYVLVMPDNLVYSGQEPGITQGERQLVKQQWFGRFLLMDNSHIKDVGAWLQHMLKVYDEKTSNEFINQHKAVTFFLLEQNMYLSDILKDLYFKKEHYESYTKYPNQTSGGLKKMGF